MPNGRHSSGRGICTRERDIFSTHGGQRPTYTQSAISRQILPSAWARDSRATRSVDSDGPTDHQDDRDKDVSGQQMKKAVGNIIFALVVCTVVFSSLLPFLWFLNTSLKTQIDVTAIPPTLLPSGSLHFYQSAIEQFC